jgi:hypothetical protein
VAIVVLAHGAWSAAWAWKKVRPLMAAAGHQFFTPTYTGLGQRAHLAAKHFTRIFRGGSQAVFLQRATNRQRTPMASVHRRR